MVALELETDPAAALELETDPAAALELETDPAAALELGIVPVAAELVRARAVKLATAQPHGHLAALAKTRSVTAPRRRDLAHLMVEDLAAAVATTREPAAIEAATVWVVVE